MFSQDKRSPALTDEDTMPFGKHKGELLSDVPASYLIWLSEQDWISDWPRLKNYIWNCQTDIEQETGNKIGFK